MTKLESFYAAVRPIGTLMLLAAQIGLAWIYATTGADNAKEAFSILAPFTMMAQTYWFRSRDEHA